MINNLENSFEILSSDHNNFILMSKDNNFIHTKKNYAKKLGYQSSKNAFSTSPIILFNCFLPAAEAINVSISPIVLIGIR